MAKGQKKSNREAKKPKKTDAERQLAAAKATGLKTLANPPAGSKK